jgi:plastocyanin
MRRTAVALAIGTLVLASACGGSSGTKKSTGTAAKPGATVSIDFSLFAKKDFAIKTGQALTFVNNNPITHEIVEGPWKADSQGQRTSEMNDGTFDLKIDAKKGFTAEHVFDKAGTFQFFCTIHKGMNATVTVS